MKCEWMNVLSIIVIGIMHISNKVNKTTEMHPHHYDCMSMSLHFCMKLFMILSTKFLFLSVMLMIAGECIFINETSIFMWAKNRIFLIKIQNCIGPTSNDMQYFLIILIFIIFYGLCSIFSTIISTILVPSSSIEIASFAYIGKNKAKTNKDSHIHRDRQTQIT